MECQKKAKDYGVDLLMEEAITFLQFPFAASVQDSVGIRVKSHRPLKTNTLWGR